MGIKTSVQVELRPFTVPNFVTREGRVTYEDGEECVPPSIAIADLSAEALDKLCDEFRTAVFKKAGKERPPMAGLSCPECGELL